MLFLFFFFFFFNDTATTEIYTLSLHDALPIVYVDGKLVPEPYVPSQYEDLSDFALVRVPKDSYFVMGDHRISSNDSRVFGPVESRYIYGRAVFAYWPVDHFGSLSTTDSDTK